MKLKVVDAVAAAVPVTVATGFWIRYVALFASPEPLPGRALEVAEKASIPEFLVLGTVGALVPAFLGYALTAYLGRPRPGTTQLDVTATILLLILALILALALPFPMGPILMISEVAFIVVARRVEMDLAQVSLAEVIPPVLVLALIWGAGIGLSGGVHFGTDFVQFAPVVGAPANGMYAEIGDDGGMRYLVSCASPSDVVRVDQHQIVSAKLNAEPHTLGPSLLGILFDHTSVRLGVHTAC